MTDSGKRSQATQLRWVMPAGRIVALAAALFGAACSSLPPEALASRAASNAVVMGADTRLGAFYRLSIANRGDESGFKLVSAGVAGLTARIDMIDAAQRSIDVQSYIFRADTSGRRVVAALLRASERGVRIRVLVDDADTVPGDEKILALSAHAGFEVRIYNPLIYRGHNGMRRGAEFLFNKSRLDYRMHNKLMVADNAVAIIGGRNIGDQYFQIAPGSQFGDDDVIAIGPVVTRLSTVFDRFWNSMNAITAESIDRRHSSAQALKSFSAELATLQSRPLDRQAEETSKQRPFLDLMDGRASFQWAAVSVIFDSPDKKDVENGSVPGRLIYKAVAEQARATTVELLMVTAYFVPSSDQLADLVDERGRRVRVRILTNSLKAAPSAEAHSGYMRYRVPLLQAGVELYEVRALLGSSPGSGQGRAISRYGNYALHAKLFVFDRRRLLLGSMNFDRRSKRLNTEVGLLIDSANLSAEVIARFEELTQLDNSYTLSLAGDRAHPSLRWTTRENKAVISYDREPARTVWQRMRVRLLSWLPLDPEL